MIGFGILIGLIFPSFVLFATSVSESEILTLKFFIMTTTAGILVGVVNLLLAKKIVGAKVQQLSIHMKKVEKRLDNSNLYHAKENGRNQVIVN